MTTAWAPRPDDDRYCTSCGAHRNLHTRHQRLCPVPYRADSLGQARRELAAAEERGDPAAVFVARGNVQRLGGDPDLPGTAEGWAGPAPHDPADPDGDP